MRAGDYHLSLFNDVMIPTNLLDYVVHVSFAVRGGYVPGNCREWQNHERRDVSSITIADVPRFQNDKQ